MADLLPSSPEVDEDGDPRVVGVDSEDADDLIAALSSTTARRILAELHEDPAPPSELADRVDTSIQNVQYHLGRLEDADVVTVAGTAYSEKGREMNVYAPADRPLVFVAGGEDDTTDLRTALSRLVGGLGGLAVGSVLLDRLLRAPPTFGAGAQGESAGGDGGDGGGAGDGGDGGDAGASGADGTAATEEPSVLADDGNVTETVRETATTTDAGTATPSATGTPTPSPTGTPTPSATGTPEPTPTPTPTPEPTPTATLTPTPSPTETPIPATTTVETVASEPTTAVDLLAASPGALFFLGGATVLVAGFLWWYVRTGR